MPKDEATTLVYAPGSKRVTAKLKGHIPPDAAVEAARRDLEAGIASAKAALDSPSEEWRVRHAANAASDNVTLNPDGSVTFVVLEDLDDDEYE